MNTFIGSIHKKLLTFRAWLLVASVEKMKKIYGPVLHPKRKPWEASIMQLRAFPSGSLGYALATFIEEHNFKLIPLYETHDIFHVLTGYKTDVIEEATMQFFLWGNGKWTPSTLVTVILSMAIMPDHYRRFYRAYCRGKRCAPVYKWDYRFLLHESLETLQQIMEKKQVISRLVF